MGVVYAGYDRERGTEVALKTLRHLDTKALSRFKREFRALQDIDHPNLITLGELFEHDGEWFFTMERIHGVDFLAYVRGTAMAIAPTATTLSDDADTLPALAAPASAAGYDETRLRTGLAQLATGLVALHRAGKVHRDVKPSNILVTGDDRVVLLDFGLIIEADRPGVAPITDEEIAGTAAYMAPEQAATGRVGPEADWYSVGVMLYQALTGRLPFEATTAFQLLMKKQQHLPPPPRQRIPEVPRDLDALCVDLLAIAPADRPPTQQILERLGVDSQRAIELASDTSARSSDATFVGREAELAALDQAFDESGRGARVAVLVRSDSGVGKTELVRTFTRNLVDRVPNATVLAGRCFERETVPYKAFDSVAEALSQHLARLGDAECAAILPLRAALLAELFPVLRRVKAVAEAPFVTKRPADPRERRRQMFAAFRELIARLCERRRVVIVIDDFQWVDPDSLALLTELQHPGEAPPALLLVTERSGHTGADVIPGDVQVIDLEPLSPPECARLVAELSPRLAGTVAVDDIARESHGHPLFIHELVRYRYDEGRPRETEARLDDVLWERVSNLPAHARRLIELLAVAGAPVSQEVTALAFDGDPAEHDKALSLLRVGRLARTTGPSRRDAVETYHDRIREAVSSRLEASALPEFHRRLAFALEQSGVGTSEPHVLVRHFAAAGYGTRASVHAIAAGEHAARASAFVQAAEFYRTALRLGDYDAERQRDLLELLGTALGNAGQLAEAAKVYLRAADGAPATVALDYRRRAMEQLLRAGDVEAGVAMAEDVLGEVGIRMPRTDRRALASLLWHRVRRGVRGLRFRERGVDEIPARTIRQLDTAWSASSSLAFVNPMLGASIQMSYLLRALRAGEPYRVSLALSCEVGYVGWRGRKNYGRAMKIWERALALAEETGEPYARAFAYAVRGLAAFLCGHWLESLENFEIAEPIFVNETTGAAYDLTLTRVYRASALLKLGRIEELIAIVPRYLREAEDSGNVYGATIIKSWRSNATWLAMDQPEVARQHIESTAAPTGARFQLRDYYRLVSSCQVDLYDGDLAGAWHRLEAQWEALRRHHVLRSQSIRTEALWLRGRCATGMATTVDERTRTPYLEVARQCIRLLRREQFEFADAAAAMLEASASSLGGDRAGAIRAIEAAARLAVVSDMALLANVARYRLGTLRGGDEGGHLRDDAEAWMHGQKIVAPQRLVRLYSPGLVDA